MTPDNSNLPLGITLPDIQKTPDHRNIPIQKVGVKEVKHPIVVLDRANERQHTIGNFALTVSLPPEVKGTHMSRFLEVLSENQGEVSVHSIPRILSELREKLHAEDSFLEVQFPFFIRKKAPVSGLEGMQEYNCMFKAHDNGVVHLEIVLRAQIATLCPCSKEISKYGAHNQRGEVTLTVSTSDHVWIEDLIEMVEASASCALYPVLKRPDEKFVTERAYENPRFVEDVIREVATRMNQDSRILKYEIEVENFESIHAHNAYAALAFDKRLA